MKKISAFILIMFFVLISNVVYGQINQTNYSTDSISFDISFNTVFGKPRTPLPNSFYNSSMWNYDWSQKHGIIQQKELSLFGTAKEIKTHGKTVVYDAAMTALPGTSNSGGGDKIIINTNYVSLSTGNNNIFIPIQYTGDKSVNPQSFSRREKEEIAKYVEKALNISGATPSSVVIDVKNNDFNIVIYKSKYTNEEAIVQSFKIKERVKTEGIAEVERLINNVQLSKAASKLDALKKQFPHALEFEASAERLNLSHEVANYNQNYKNVRVLYIEDNSGNLNIYNGIKEKGESSVFNLSPAIDYINTNLSSDVNELYLIIKSSSPKEQEGVLRSIRTQIKSKRPNLRVEAAPDDAKTREVFFYGKVVEKTNSKKIVSLKHDQEYRVSMGGKYYRMIVGMEVMPAIVFKKAKKMIKNFYQYFDSHLNSKRTLCSLVNNSRKQVKANFPAITDEDFNTWIKEQFGNTHIVLIEIIEETSENEWN